MTIYTSPYILKRGQGGVLTEGLGNVLQEPGTTRANSAKLVQQYGTSATLRKIRNLTENIDWNTIIDPTIHPKKTSDVKKTRERGKPIWITTSLIQIATSVGITIPENLHHRNAGIYLTIPALVTMPLRRHYRKWQVGINPQTATMGNVRGLETTCIDLITRTSACSSPSPFNTHSHTVSALSRQHALEHGE